MNGHQVVIVGAGPSGVAAAVSLRDRGLHPLLMDRADEVAASLAGTLRPAQTQHRPGLLTPARASLSDKAPRHTQPARMSSNTCTGTRTRTGLSCGWVPRCAESTSNPAAGCCRPPAGTSTPDRSSSRPDTSTRRSSRTGQERTALSASCCIPLITAIQTPYLGKRVLVVGGGSSGFEIATDVATGGARQGMVVLAHAPQHPAAIWHGHVLRATSSTKLACHAPPRLADRMSKLARRVNFGDLTEFGLPIPAEGPFARVGADRQGSCHCRPSRRSTQSGIAQSK